MVAFWCRSVSASNNVLCLNFLVISRYYGFLEADLPSHMSVSVSNHRHHHTSALTLRTLVDRDSIPVKSTCSIPSASR